MTDSALPLTSTPAPARVEVLGVLADISQDEKLGSLSAALTQLRAYAGADLAAVEVELAGVPRSGDVVGRSLQHLLTLEGKRLRPLCVALASRIANPDAAAPVQLATAVELVHSATLLHDDVVDSGDLRRGQPTARVLYGNAASVFAGDWLLIEALRRVQQAGVPGVLDALLSTIDEMIQAEALQLECRGRLMFDESTYFRIIEGKTASLFRWAMLAGARAGGLSDEACLAIQTYGFELGVAFQIVDDALDLAGDAAQTGKALFADLHEGKMTFPLIVGAARDPGLPDLVREAMTGPNGATGAAAAARVMAALDRTGAIRATHERARAHVDRARASLEGLPQGPATRALALVAEAAIQRSK